MLWQRLLIPLLQLILFLKVNMITGLRVSEEEEQQGLDIVSHEEKGYDL